MGAVFSSDVDVDVDVQESQSPSPSPSPSSSSAQQQAQQQEQQPVLPVLPVPLPVPVPAAAPGHTHANGTRKRVRVADNGDEEEKVEDEDDDEDEEADADADTRGRGRNFMPNRHAWCKKSRPAAKVDEFETLLRVSKPPDVHARHLLGTKIHKTVVDGLKPGMLIYHPARLVVKSVSVKDGVRSVDVENLDAPPGCGSRMYTYQGDGIIADHCYNCDQYFQVKQTTMTDMARIIKEEVGDMLCKVEFTKEPVPSEMVQLLARGTQLIEATTTTAATATAAATKARQYARLYERVQKGEYRIMRGYIMRDAQMTAQETETGMMKFLDADLVAGGVARAQAQRQLNLRHVQALVFNGVRYERQRGKA